MNSESSTIKIAREADELLLTVEVVGTLLGMVSGEGRLKKITLP